VHHPCAELAFVAWIEAHNKNSIMSSETSGTIRRVITAFALFAVGFAAGWMAATALAFSSGRPSKYAAWRHTATRLTRRGRNSRTIARASRRLPERDVNAIDGYMTDLFPNADSVQVFGASANEWNRGFDAVSKFIRMTGRSGAALS